MRHSTNVISVEDQEVIQAKLNFISDYEDLIEVHERKRGIGWREHIAALSNSIKVFRKEIDEIRYS